MAPSFASQFNVAVDMEATWHYLGATDLGAELSAIDLDTEVLTCVFWHLK
jgi:hypothetical protein